MRCYFRELFSTHCTFGCGVVHSPVGTSREISHEGDIFTERHLKGKPVFNKQSSFVIISFLCEGFFFQKRVFVSIERRDFTASIKTGLMACYSFESRWDFGGKLAN